MRLPEANSTTHRGEILDEAKALTEGDRNIAYGSPYDNMSQTSGLWNAYLGQKLNGPLTASDVAQMMALLKIARTLVSPSRLDNYIDAAAYIAIASECQPIEKPAG